MRGGSAVSYARPPYSFPHVSSWMDPSILYESLFTDISPRGVEGVFDSIDVTQLLSVLKTIREHAAV